MATARPFDELVLRVVLADTVLREDALAAATRLRAVSVASTATDTPVSLSRRSNDLC